MKSQIQGLPGRLPAAVRPGFPPPHTPPPSREDYQPKKGWVAPRKKNHRTELEPRKRLAEPLPRFPEEK